MTPSPNRNIPAPQRSTRPIRQCRLDSAAARDLNRPDGQCGSANNGRSRLLRATATPNSAGPQLDIPLSPVCQGALRLGQVTGGPWRGRKPDKCPGIDGQEEADWWPWQCTNPVGWRPKSPLQARIEG